KTMKDSVYEDVRRAKSSLGTRFARTGLILGTELGGLHVEIAKKKSVRCQSISGFPECYREHELIFGEMFGEPVVCIENLPSIHEGASAREIGFPAWFFSALGARQLLITAAGGSLNAKMKAGSLLIVEDHLNFTGHNPLLGVQD